MTMNDAIIKENGKAKPNINVTFAKRIDSVKKRHMSVIIERNEGSSWLKQYSGLQMQILEEEIFNIANKCSLERESSFRSECSTCKVKDSNKSEFNS